MQKNEIKKLLYKIKPKAELMYVSKDRLWYVSRFESGEAGVNYVVSFSIPLEDIGDAKFHPVMDAKLLIRWID